MTEIDIVSSAKLIDPLILTVRSQRAMLDADLAELFGVPNKALNQAVKRNAARFPADFVFQLTAEELEVLRSQIVTANAQTPASASYDAFRAHGAGDQRRAGDSDAA